MRGKIKLISICIRHKCTKSNDDNLVKTYKKFATKVVRVKRSAKPLVKEPALTSKPVARIIEILPEYNETVNDEKNSDSISGDVGMRMLHRPTLQLKPPELQYDFIEKNVKTILVKRPTKEKSEPIEVSSENRVNDEYQSEKNNIAIEVENHEDPKETETKIHLENNELRFNELNMQMLSRRLFEQIFPNHKEKEKLPSDKLRSLRKRLIESGMNVDDVSRLPDVDIELPAFEGKDVEEHFYNIGRDQIKPYLKIIHAIMEKIPKMPEKWLLQEGWTRYIQAYSIFLFIF